MDGRTFDYVPEDVTVEREVLSDWAVQSDGPFVVAVDPVLDPPLRREGLAREVVNRVQRLRKEAGYDYTTRIFLAVAGPPEVVSAASDHADFIRGETLAPELTVGGRLVLADLEQELDIDGFPVIIGVRRQDGRAGPG